MNKWLYIFVIIMTSLSNSAIFCDDIDPYIKKGYDKEDVVRAIKEDRKVHFLNECVIEGGEGSSYGYDGGWVPECDGKKSENGFVKSKISCDFCAANWVKQELKDAEDACREDCRTSNYHCVPADLAELWGGEIKKISSNLAACGSPLPNCSVSSSSEVIESSSSEEQSSSSIENGSSSEESSSSEDLDFSSSDEGDCGEDGPYDCSSASEESSSSEVLCPCTDEDGPCFDDDGICSESESSSSIENTSSSSESNVVACYKPDGNGGCKFSRYVSKVRPPMHGEPSLSDSHIIFCEYTDNQIYVGYFAELGLSLLVSEAGASMDPCNYDENNCGNLTSVITPPMLQSPFYECWMGELDKNGCKEKMGMAVYVDKNLQIAERTASWIPSNVTREQIIAMGDEIIRREREMNVYYNGERIGFGHFSNRSIQTLKGAVDFCDYIIKEYERKHSSSSSTQVQSSCSSVESSSSVVELSSSSEKLLSSSSDDTPESSSSFIEEGSSSSVGAETFVSDGNQIYTPDQIFKEGLQNMEDGLCYSLNPERGTVSGWNISYNAQDSWWWREVDCETGDKVDRNRVGACPGFPLDNVPSNPERACIAYNGQCYKCNSSNSFVDCSADWLWKYSFDLGLVSRGFYKQVDCYDPFEEDVDLKCYKIDLNDDENDEFFLLKQQSNESEYYEEYSTINSEVNIINKIYYYDALGRNISKNKLKNNKSYFIDFKGLGSEQSLVTRILKKDKTYSGYIKGTVVISWCETKTEKDGRYDVNHIEVSMNVISGPIHVESNDERLIAHEKGHKEIWDDGKYKKTEILTVSIPEGKTKKEVCELEAERSWAYVRDDLYDIYTRHNNWDDSDVNNISHARINVLEQMRKHEEKLLNKCK